MGMTSDHMPVRPACTAALCAALCVAMPLAAAAPTDEKDVPSAVDLRPNFARYRLDIRAQGPRPTCSVFTMTGAIEYALAVRDGHATRLSVEFLNWSSNREAGDADDGSFFSDLWSGFARYGLCPESIMPYQDTFDPKREPSEDAIAAARPLRIEGFEMHWIKRWNPNTGLTDEELVNIKRSLARGWPVAGGFRWPKKEEWNGHVLITVPPEEVIDGHSVLLVGYRDDAAVPGGGTFLIRNSGKGVKDAAMTYAYARQYMNDAVWVGHSQPPAAESGTRPPRDLLHPMSPAPAGRNRRVSSNEQPAWNHGNDDMDWLMPGDAVEMPLLEGPGVITHMWFTSHAGWANELNALVLRIYYDGRAEPGVEVPLGDFFAIGDGQPAVVESIPVQVSPTGSLTCFWRMPFEKSARLVVTNDNPDRSTGLYWQVDWTQVKSLPAQTPYFYARCRQEYPAVMGRDYVLADLEGTGWYVGTVLAVTMAQNGWFGEGDDFFTIDGETVPSLQGTGSEDYFNYAWGFGPRTSHFFGHPRVQGDRAGDSIICYRWHLPDSVNFEQSLRVAIEHKGNSDDATEAFYLERPDFFSSVALWYQTGTPKAWPKLPAYPQRRVPWEHHHLVRALRRARADGSAQPRVQTVGLFGARPTLRWENETPGATLSFPFDVSEDGRYAVRLTAEHGPGMGAFEVRIDDVPAGRIDLGSNDADEADLLLGTHTLTKGAHTLTFKAPQAEDRSRRGQGGQPRTGALVVEMLRLLKLPPEAARTVRTDNEAHFIRLGIGRSLYAYRLVNGRLPDSLQEMVDDGIMPPRYLNDENNQPLKFRVMDGYFEVESTGPNRWTHRWQGLDARR